MMRKSTILACLALAACGKAPEGSADTPDIGGNATAGVAFTYAYGFAMPSSRIADLQETHADACERLGVARCRITGLRYAVGSSGGVSASLSVRLAAPIARRFGRQAMASANGAGATLTGVEIGGTERADAIAAGDRMTGEAIRDRAAIERDLARPNLSSRERAALIAQRAVLVDQARAATNDADTARADIATAPMTFDYATGRGTAFPDRLRDAGDMALSSVSATLTALLWFIAVFGPPILVLGILFLIWRRWGQRVWTRVTGKMPAG